MKKKHTGVSMAFLDVLSNALAAVLIISLVKMKPDTAGDPIAGTFYIGARSDSRVANDSTLAIGVRFAGDSLGFAHEPNEYFPTIGRLNYSSGSTVRLNFMREPRLSEMEEVYVYALDPDFGNTEGEGIEIEVVLPGTNRTFTNRRLNPENEYRIQIIKQGKLKLK